MSKPAWLDDDMDASTSSDDPFGDGNANDENMFAQGSGSGGGGQQMTPKQQGLASNNNYTVTPPPTEKPSDMPEFLRNMSPQATSKAQECVEPTPVKKAPPKKGKHGEVVEVDFDEDAPVNGSFAGTSNAPVHFLKRMQEAEAAKKARKEKKAKERDANGGVTPSKKKEKKEKKERKATTPRKKDPAEIQSGPSMAEVIASGGIEDTTANVDLSVIPDLSDQNKEKFSDVIGVFNEELVAKLCSNKWQHRLAAVQEVEGKICDLLDKDAIKNWSVACDVMQTTFVDAVMQVYVATGELLATCLGHCTFLDESSVVAMQNVAKALSNRLKDSNTKIRDGAIKSFTLLSDHKCIGPIFALDVICGVEGTTNDAKSWMALITKMDAATNITKNDDGLVQSCKDMLMKLCAQGLNCSNVKVRKRATVFATDIYKVIGRDIEPYLSSVSAATVRQLKQELEIEVCDVNPLEDENREEDTDIATFDAEENNPMGEEQKVLAELWSDALQLRSCKCIFSSRWKLREQLVDRLHKRVLEAIESKGSLNSSSKPTLNLKDNNVLQSLAQIEEKALNDSVPAVVSVAIHLVKSTIPIVPQMHLVEFATPLVNVLIKKHLTSAQTATAATEAVILTAKNPKFGAGTVCDIIMDEEAFSNGDITKTSVKIVQSRLDILARVVETFGFEEPNMSVDRTMKYAVAGFDHPQAKARTSAANLIVEVYKQAGNVVQSYLSNLKGALLSDLKEKINAIARKDRTRTAPIQRLANIVQPLGGGGGGGGPHQSGAQTPNSRPATIGSKAELANNYGESGASVRSRILQWNEMKKQESGAMQPEQSGSPQGPSASDGSSPEANTKPGDNGKQASPDANRPPAAPSKKKRDKIRKLVTGTGGSDDEFGDDSDSDGGPERMPLAIPPGPGNLSRPSAPNKKSRLIFS